MVSALFQWLKQNPSKCGEFINSVRWLKSLLSVVFRDIIPVILCQDRPGADAERCRDRILLQHEEEPPQRQTGAS